MNLTEQQKVNLLGAMGATGAAPPVVIKDFIDSEGMQGQITVGQARAQLSQTHRLELMTIQGPRFFSRFTENFCGQTGLTVEQCDAVIAALQDAEVIIEAKKAELQA